MPAPSFIAIIGAGPAGLMAAETLAASGIPVRLYDAMPSFGRKFLLAGVGGMNITHAEAHEPFVRRYGPRQAQVGAWLQDWGSLALRQWIGELGIETFVGSSGRVFPKDMKAAPLLRAWLKRLREQGVEFYPRHRWQGWSEDGGLLLETPEGMQTLYPKATLLAMGGGSWPRLGSDASWFTHLQQRDISLAPLQPSNCGFEVAQWSEHFLQRFAGQPVKPVSILAPGQTESRQGEFVITRHGVEGSLVYALSAGIREQIRQHGQATLYLDLLPGQTPSRIQSALEKPRGRKSMSNHLRSQLGLEGVRAGLLRELASREAFDDPGQLAVCLKHLPLTLVAARPLEEAISSAGGVRFEALDANLMLNSLPGVFCAGEMLDWEAPTGGYLLTACFSSGRAAGLGMLRWLAQPDVNAC